MASLQSKFLNEDKGESWLAENRWY